MIEVTIDVTELIGNLKAKNMNGEPEMKSREMKKKKKTNKQTKSRAKKMIKWKKRINNQKQRNSITD